MSGPRRTVLVTGASGSVGRALAPALADRYALRLHSRSGTLEPPPGPHEVVGGDVERRADVEAMVAGADAIVHLAGQASAQSTWEQVRGPNVEGTWNVFDAACAAGVRKVVFASTNHVMGMYDRDRAWPIHPDQPLRPDGPYGVSKAFGEALARYMADAYAIDMICLRIGWVLERPLDEQGLRMWLSPRDLGELVVRSLEADVRFGVYYGVSANARCRWDVDNARRELGFQAVDDSEAFATEVLGSDA